ncbi:efflux RND transporter periplasmic adaptor subunit [Thermomonas sp. HDW16]|uniref:efflux RND transporter periplasmic adaptor subunit n=1 Tax=Thermomonas sp. HDW16 TaxID=2714945 RepID=UPI00140B43D6|nr:efflux RND transporter periplasmic adaptor subunit [Thermomonas sp. HDW16]QIL19540.1 efflux RND transporter periplasmic adaptor subunit [Thermomonas sp. HDW16]
MPSLRSRAVLPAVLIASTLALAACGGDAPPPGQAGATPVTVVTLKPESVTLTRELAGRAEASQEAEVRPQVGGIVERLLFTEGGSVRAGQPLYQLDQTSYRADANSAQAAVARTQATLVTAQLNAKRSAELVKIDAVSRQDNDNAQAALRQAQADLRSAQAGLQGANVPLGFTRVTAPISGRIGRSSVTRGALVTASQATPLAVIQSMDPMYVEISQSSTELLQLRREIAAGNLQGTEAVPVDIVLEDGSVYPQQGRLSFAEAMVDPGTGAVALRVIVPNPDQMLLPGMFVRAKVANGERRNAILAPQQGITRDPRGNASAMVVGADGKVEQRAVKVSRSIGDKWLVDDGLKAGDKVIVEGLQKIKPGAEVQATERGSEAKPAASTAAKPAASGA